MTEEEKPLGVSDFIQGLEDFNTGIDEDVELRIADGRSKISFGISFLDDTFGGIYKNDLIVLGAKSGVGKTQICTLIATAASKAGKRVVYFALEAEKREIQRRIRYQVLSDLYFADPLRTQFYLNYTDWRYGNLAKELETYERLAVELIKDTKLKVYYRQKEFNHEEFQRIYMSLKSETDLIILDHLHYIDFEDVNENRGIKTILQTIRELTINLGVPVILVSHIRKTDKRFKTLLPDLEDFHGSSEIGKIATKALVLAPDYTTPITTFRRPTFLSILKNRVDGGRTRFVGMTSYNLNKQSYDDKYWLGFLNSEGTEFTKIETENVPFWAKSALNYKERK